jgi:hypothetical protein
MTTHLWDDYCHLAWWDADTHTQMSELKFSKFRSTCLDVTRDGARIVVGTESGSIAIIQANSLIVKSSLITMVQNLPTTKHPKT